MDQPLLFLIKLAWACRYRLPLLIAIGFMALDIRMQLEIHVQMRRIRRDRQAPSRGIHDQQNDLQRHRTQSEGSSTSWVTIDDDATESDSIQDLLMYSESEEDTEFHETMPMQSFRGVSVAN